MKSQQKILVPGLQPVFAQLVVLLHFGFFPSGHDVLPQALFSAKKATRNKSSDTSLDLKVTLMLKNSFYSLEHIIIFLPCPHTEVFSQEPVLVSPPNNFLNQSHSP
jgi:hypothetical protein